MNTIGFIGGGRVARILIGGWVRAGSCPPTLLVHDPDAAALEALMRVAPGIQRSQALEAAAADVVFVALHPPAIEAALAAIRPAIRQKAALVSLAPKITIGALSAQAGTLRVARMIPNAPSLIGQGYNPVSFGPHLDEPARSDLTALFKPWGEAPEVPEGTLEAYALLTGMGPTYFWFQWQALRELAEQLGLGGRERDAALRAMIHGSLATLLDSGLSPSAVMDLVPVKPLATIEPPVLDAYRTSLPALHAKISPGALAGAIRPA